MMAITKQTPKLKHRLFWLCLTAFFAPLQALSAPVLQQMTPELSVHLNDGAYGMLAGIVPVSSAAQLPDGWMDEAVRVQEATTDRYGEAHWWVYRASDGALLQTELVTLGLAMAYRHDAPLPPELAALSAPEAARYTAHNAGEALSRWAEIYGELREATITRNGAYLNFGEDWKKDLTIYLPKQTLKQFDEDDLRALEGKELRVRGWVHSYYGPRITLHEPSMMKVSDEP